MVELDFVTGSCWKSNVSEKLVQGGELDMYRILFICL